MFLVFWLFDPNWPFCKVYSLCKMADFQNGLISWIYGIFLQRFFAQNNSNVILESFFSRFWPFEFLTQTDRFAKSYPLQDGRFSKWSHFSNIWCFFKRFFAQNNSNVLVESFFALFWPFEFLSQTDHFAKSIAFARWPILKIVLFLEYMVFFPAFFSTEQL